MRERDFDALVRRHAGAVGAYARALTADRCVAEDAVQETFVRAWRYLDSFDGRGSFEGWLLRICRNCVVDLAARRSTVAELPLDLVAPQDTRGEVYQLIKHLPLHQREVIVLCAVLGYDYRDAADMLGVPVGTVRSRLNRARGALAEALADQPHQRVVGG